MESYTILIYDKLFISENFPYYGNLKNVFLVCSLALPRNREKAVLYNFS